MSWHLNKVKEDGNKNVSFKNLFETKNKIFSSPTAQYTDSKPDLKESKKEESEYWEGCQLLYLGEKEWN